MENETPELVDLQIGLGLSPTLAKVLQLLLSSKIVTYHMIEQEHNITNDSKVSVFRLRRYLGLPSEYDIQSARGVGYWLDQKSKDHILEKLHNNLPDEVANGG